MAAAARQCNVCSSNRLCWLQLLGCTAVAAFALYIHNCMVWFLLLLVVDVVYLCLPPGC